MILAFALPGLAAVDKILLFLLMLSVLVVLHEAGHFLLARLNGVRVNDFAVGFGPTLAKWTSKRSGTNYRLNLLPIGGYCAMQGEDGENSEAEQQRAYRETMGRQIVRDPKGANFQSKSAWARLAIIVAGPAANFVLAYVILVVAAVSFGIISDSSKTTTDVGPVYAGTPAEKAGLAPGDRITAIDGVIYGELDGDKLVDRIHASAGKTLSLTYVRHGVPTTIRIVPVSAKVGTQHVGRIGFTPLGQFQRVGLVAALGLSGVALVNDVTTQVQGVAQLISNPVAHASEVSGPIGMARAAGVYQDIGWGAYLQLAAMISLALGIFNLLPVPALDGGRGVFILAELVRGRPVDAEKEAFVHVAGFAVLMGLIALVAYHDIARAISGKGVF